MVINTVNHWHLVEKLGGANPVAHRAINQYYADANLLKPVNHQYTFFNVKSPGWYHEFLSVIFLFVMTGGIEL
jgi:hypothetical protein